MCALPLTSQANKVRLRTVLRQQEVETVFRRVPDAEFDEVLELGAGDGSQSRILVRCAKNVVCTELNADRLVQESQPNIRYQICDAEALPFEEGKFDLVYSSNLLEHLPQPEVALTEMYRVLSDDGVMVHIVPNRFWKFLHLSLFYPNQMVSMAGILLSSRKRETVGGLESRDADPNAARMGAIGGRDLIAFAEYFEAGANRSAAATGQNRVDQTVCTGPITYIGYADLQADIDNFNVGLKGSTPNETFLPAITPGTVEQW